ncbi:MAG TPA: hypothetical protein PK402_09920, partial [Tepidisphaeraceae bacterium]|nr:hypothetical protein [Tepidisphaeraceae bacterium]
VEEVARLRSAWKSESMDQTLTILESLFDDNSLNEIDPFDRAQLAEVVRVCRSSRSLSDAGRKLFSASRAKKESTNDADRLRKYLARFGMNWANLSES